MKPKFSAAEKAALRIAQDNISTSLTPYADIAQAAGLTEKEVLDLFTRLKDTGAIRRFGASIRHQKAGWTHNAMVAWQATLAEADAASKIIQSHPRISHAYFRPSNRDDWPYTFYTMVHGRSEEECGQTVLELAEKFGFGPYAVLRSIRELKKTSMLYFV